MKKKLLRLAAICCCTLLLGTLFTSCNDDNGDGLIFYTVNDDMVGGDPLVIGDYMTDYGDALYDAFGRAGTDDDKLAVKVCDQVYQQHQKDEYFNEVRGEFRLCKFKTSSFESGGDGAPIKILKHYKYNKYGK